MRAWIFGSANVTKLSFDSTELRTPPFLERYKEHVSDWEAFIESVNRPLPSTIWVNPLRCTRDWMVSWLSLQGIESRLHEWNSIGIELETSQNLGRSFPFLLGYFHFQESVSMLPVLLHPPSSGDRVLDICAAPGNKTVLASIVMQNKGQILANDRHKGRLHILQKAASRLGCLNISTTCLNATQVDVSQETFDHVICDVPCGCEGTLRKNRNVFLSQKSYAGKMQSIQRSILKRAFSRLRVGGTLIYATCTFAPEENEENIDWFLKKNVGTVATIPLQTPPGWKFSPAMNQWEGVKFDSQIRHAVRIWPHENNTGGFFICALKRTH